MPDAASPGRLSTIASAALLGGTIFTLADLFSNNHLFAGIAITLIVCHILMRWRHVRTNAKVLLLLAALSGALLVLTGGDPGSLALAASRALYLPALLAVMAILRVAAMRSNIVSTAAHSSPRRGGSPCWPAAVISSASCSISAVSSFCSGSRWPNATAPRPRPRSVRCRDGESRMPSCVASPQRSCGRRPVWR